MEPPTRCAACATLPDYVEVEDEPLPPSTAHLASPSPELAKAYEFTDERLLTCHACGTYYAARRWHPGGSCDVMHTCTHESMRRMRIFEVPLELGARVGVLAADRDRHQGTSLAEHYATALSGIHAELVALQARAVEIILDAVNRIRHRHADSTAFVAAHGGAMPSYYPSGYLDEMRQAELTTARRCARLLEIYAPLAAAGAWRQEIAALADDPDEQIRAAVTAVR